MQIHSSKNTSQHFKECGKAYKHIPDNVKTILDYGCGKYDTNKEFCIKKGMRWIGYDPYHLSWGVNQHARKQVDEDGVDCIVCSHVLNVIDTLKVVDEVLLDIVSLSSEDTIVIFACYQGDGSGKGKETKKDCWQRNEKPDVWKKRISKLFDIIEHNGEIFVCKKKENQNNV